MAALPSALVAHALAGGPGPVVGVHPPSDVVAAPALLAALEAAGLRIVDGDNAGARMYKSNGGSP
jgi:hypothetical protein